MRVHPSHLTEARRTAWVVGVGLLGVLVVAMLPSLPTIRGLAGYVPLHTGLEVLSIAVALSIFGISWSLRRQTLPRYALVLGSAFLGVGLLDFGHMLSYQGMPDFVTPSSPEKAIHFWLAARSVGALALLMVALPWVLRPSRLAPRWWLALTLLAVVGVFVLLLSEPAWLPRTFVAGKGLAPFKVGFEYGLIAVHLLTAVLLLRSLTMPRVLHVSSLLAAVCLMAQSEFFFTLYADVTDLYNLTGHIYKVLAYAYLYQAVFTEMVNRPYELLHESERQISATLMALPDLLFEMDEQGRYHRIHVSRQQELTFPADYLLGRTVEETMPAEAAATVMAGLAEAAQHGRSYGRRIHVSVQDGGYRWFEISVARADRQTPYFIVISRDVTDRVRDEETLRQLSLAVEQSPMAMMITNLQGDIEYVNPAFTRSSGYSSAEVLGRNPRLLRSGKTPTSTYRAMWQQLAQGQPWQGEVINRRKNGQEYTESMLLYLVRDAQGQATHYLALKEDISERKQVAAHIEQLTRHDLLTGLPNRSLLYEFFERTRQQTSELAVLWVDFDHFKEINDALGHSMGDLLLQTLARRLQENLNQQDMLSRHAGDDFIAVLPGAGLPRAEQVATRLLEAAAAPVLLGEQEVQLTSTIGIALYPLDAENFDGVLHRAETAMYRAKEDGRNRLCFFAPEMQQCADRNLALSQALKQAAQRGELRLVYQPQLSLASGRIVGAEALLRWNSPQWGMVSPGEFIPLAEANGFILSLDDWVLDTALTQMRAWLDEGLPPFVLAVNLSALQFAQADLPQRVAQHLQRTGVPAACLELELTEAMAMKNPVAAAERMRQLSALGLRLSIDDFGTGYSSLNYLKRFDIHKLKIDQSFVRDLEHDSDDQAITTAIIQLARSLGLVTIAEGVETSAQQAFLQNQGCDDIQGYHFSRPLEVEAFAAFVRQHAGQ